MDGKLKKIGRFGKTQNCWRWPLIIHWLPDFETNLEYCNFLSILEVNFESFCLGMQIKQTFEVSSFLLNFSHPFVFLLYMC